MSKHNLTRRQRGELLLVAAAILVDYTLSYPNLRRFVDLLFVEGMAAIIVGSYLLTRSLKPPITKDQRPNVEFPKSSFNPKTKYRMMGTEILIIGLLLVSCAILVGEIWARKTT